MPPQFPRRIGKEASPQPCSERRVSRLHKSTRDSGRDKRLRNITPKNPSRPSFETRFVFFRPDRRRRRCRRRLSTLLQLHRSDGSGLISGRSIHLLRPFSGDVMPHMM